MHLSGNPEQFYRPTESHNICREVTTSTPFVDFWQRSLYRARIAFLWGATAISKIDTRFFISSLIDLKFCTRLEGDNTQNRVGAIFEFPPLKNLAPLWIFRLHYGQWDENFQIGFTWVSEVVLDWYFHTYWPGGVKAYFNFFSQNWSPCNSIFLNFCMFHAPFNISGTLEVSALKFSHTTQRWCG